MFWGNHYRFLNLFNLINCHSYHLSNGYANTIIYWYLGMFMNTNYVIQFHSLATDLKNAWETTGLSIQNKLIYKKRVSNIDWLCSWCSYRGPSAYLLPWRRSVWQTEILVIFIYILIHIWYLVCCVALVLLHSVITCFDACIKTLFYRPWSSSSFSASGFLLLHIPSWTFIPP